MRMLRQRFMVVALGVCVCVAGFGCQPAATVEQGEMDYSRPLGPGEAALRLVEDPNQWPNVRAAYQRADADLLAALDRSIGWFEHPSARQFFPPPNLDEITYERARVSAHAFRELLREATSASEFEQALHEQFDCYQSVGYDGRGTVLYTGYYTPIFEGSRERTETYRYPLYKRPDSLVTDPRTGEPIGRRVDDGIVPWPPRAELEASGMLDGLELVYLADRFDAYIIHVNGSARIDLAEGGTMYVGYAGKTDAEYRGIGEVLLEEGVFTPEQLSLPAIRQYFAENPHLRDRYIDLNESYVFFTEYAGDDWPSGSIGVRVTPRRTLATDKSVFPRAGAVLVHTQVPQAGAGGGHETFTQFMLDQDTGGAIRAAGRGDIYMGIGDDAERLAGRQFANGHLYYFFLRDAYLEQWRQRMNEPGG